MKYAVDSWITNYQPFKDEIRYTSKKIQKNSHLLDKSSSEMWVQNEQGHWPLLFYQIRKFIRLKGITFLNTWSGIYAVRYKLSKS